MSVPARLPLPRHTAWHIEFDVDSVLATGIWPSWPRGPRSDATVGRVQTPARSCAAVPSHYQIAAMFFIGKDRGGWAAHTVLHQEKAVRGQVNVSHIVSTRTFATEPYIPRGSRQCRPRGSRSRPNAYMAPRQGSEGAYYRVRIGPFTGKAAAQRIASGLTRGGHHVFLDEVPETALPPEAPPPSLDTK